MAISLRDRWVDGKAFHADPRRVANPSGRGTRYLSSTIETRGVPKPSVYEGFGF
jgi:hypothetical protein